jgi:hypothetical protein
MADPKNQNQPRGIVDPAENPEIPDAIAPQAGEVSHQRMTEVARVVGAGNPVSQKPHHAAPDRAIKRIQIVERARDELNPPNQSVP